jgi:hypothetical protein
VRTREEIELKLFRHDQPRVDGSEAPVEGADQALQGSSARGKDILDVEQPSGERDVCEGARGEGQGGERETDDGEVLEMPAIRVIAVGRG